MARLTTPLWEIWRLSRRAGSLLDRALRGSELSASDFGLYSLLRFSGPMTATDVSRRTGMPPTTVSQQIRRLDERGHLGRQPHPDDARSTLLSLTDTGHAAHEAAGPGFRDLLTRVELALGDDHEQVMYSLERLDRALRQADEAPGDDLPTRLPARPARASAHHVAYSGEALTADEEERVRDYIAWLRWRRVTGRDSA